MLMNMQRLLRIANENHFAIPAFNIGSLVMLNAVMECCEEEQAPVIIAIHPDELKFVGEHFVKSCIDLASKVTVPCAIHLDHSGEEYIYKAVRAGFTSVMIDASSKPLEENISISKKIVDFCHPLGVSVEAELGTIGAIGNNFENGVSDITYTDPIEAKYFVESTGIDCLAVAIGTAHGIYPKGHKPKLQLDLLSQIKAKVDVPLVLHGGSSNPDEEITESVRRGISKINISSDVKSALYTAVRRTLNENSELREPFEVYEDGIKSMKSVIKQKIELLNDNNKMNCFVLSDI